MSTARDRRVADDVNAGRESDLGSCRTCVQPTTKATLSTYGGQCLHCYSAYCREPVAMRLTPRKAQP